MSGTGKAVNVREKIPKLIKTAYNPIDPNARNVIHTDEYAQNYGMRGALVGGSTLLSYVLEMLYNYFGDNWHYHGKIKTSFIKGGAINGDVLTARGEVTGIEEDSNGKRLSLNVWLTNQDEQKVLVGEASCIQK
jgi:acyl dehydratase